MAVRDAPKEPADTAAPDVPLAALPLPRPLVLPSDVTVQTAAQAMLRADRTAVVVGSWTVVTEHDIAQAVALGRPPTTPAAAIAAHDRAVLPTNATVLDALEAMLREHTRDVVVVEDDDVVGMIDVATVIEVLLGRRDVPAWLSGLRRALPLEIHLD